MTNEQRVWNINGGRALLLGTNYDRAVIAAFIVRAGCKYYRRRKYLTNFISAVCKRAAREREVSA